MLDKRADFSWEQIIIWVIILLFLLFMLMFYGGIGGSMENMVDWMFG